MNQEQLGKFGEQLAVQYLISKGYRILRRNYRYRRAEIDILAMKDDYLVVVEVKTRNSSKFGDPQKFVSKAQIRLLVLAADHFLEETGLQAEVRFDIIAILKNTYRQQLKHYPDAFYHF